MMTNLDTKRYEANKLMAQLRFQLIAPIISNTYTENSKEEYFRRVGNLPISLPDGTIKTYKANTLKWWVHLYRKKGFDGLMIKDRVDVGSSRKLTEEVKRQIIDLLAEFPKMSATIIMEKLINDNFLHYGDLSLNTLQRYIKKNCLREKQVKSEKEVRSWSYAKPCHGYQADTSYTIKIQDDHGKYRMVYLIAMIDVCSRVIVGAQFFFEDNCVNVEKVWKKAVLNYGKSSVLILDNGTPYKNKYISAISSKLGTQLIYCTPYHPQGKACIERFNRTIKEKNIYTEKLKDCSLDELNEKLEGWIYSYNRTYHSSLSEYITDEANKKIEVKQSPIERYFVDMQHIAPYQLANKRKNEYAPWVEDCFLHETTRKVNKNSTVTIENKLFDVPSKYIGFTVIVRYTPITLKTVYLYDAALKEAIPLKPTDFVENSKIKRTTMMY